MRRFRFFFFHDPHTGEWKIPFAESTHNSVKCQRTRYFPREEKEHLRIFPEEKIKSALYPCYPQGSARVRFCDLFLSILFL